MIKNAEKLRIEEAQIKNAPWRKIGPYLSERQWGTVREDYSHDGNAWDYFSFDQACSRAYRWGEDGIAGISDDKQYLCFAFACWNERDDVIKERLFGLTNGEGNHGEDVKEYYYYLDCTPTHSYMKYLYKYPHDAFPYLDLIEENHKRTKHDPEYELIDTGIFDNDRYFDIVLEYAKASPEDIHIKISVTNQGLESARIHLLPTLWFRNIWSQKFHGEKPSLEEISSSPEVKVVKASHSILGVRYLKCFEKCEILFTDNETNNERIFNKPNHSQYVKDGIQEFLIHGNNNTVNPEKKGTKAVAHYVFEIAPGKTQCVHLQLTNTNPSLSNDSVQTELKTSHHTIEQRHKEADEFYQSIIAPTLNEDQRQIIRKSLAGMLWSKQYYFFDTDLWLNEHGQTEMNAQSLLRNSSWFHMFNDDIISMPDKWEYPWYAAWDLAFQSLPLAIVDIEFAQQQLYLTLSERYLHPSGQIPAYEWNFSDVNPPVHALATLFIYNMGAKNKTTDLKFLKRMFGKLLINFTWWVNRKDRFGKNVFEGGFLGLDNIGVFDRSNSLPGGGTIEQADGTSWMVFFCINMIEIASELASDDPLYDDLAIKFIDHFLYIASAMNQVKTNQKSLWDETDGFYYDILRLPNGDSHYLKVRSIVGLLPLCSVSSIENKNIEAVPHIIDHFWDRILRKPFLLQSIHPLVSQTQGERGRWIFSILNEDKLSRILQCMLDENEFLSPYGIRSMSLYHLEHPFKITIDDTEYKVSYNPAESDSSMFGGNSNWRGPTWFPINGLIIRALLQYYLYYGNSFKVEYPTRSGNFMNLFEISKDLSNRLSKIFLLDDKQQRPFLGANAKLQSDPKWRDHLLFHEYFHGDTGAGLGASHQTGWTGLIAVFLNFFGTIDAETYLKQGRSFKWNK